MLDIGATTAEKLEETSRVVVPDTFHFLPLFLPYVPLLLHPCFTHSICYTPLFPLNTASRSGEAVKNDRPHDIRRCHIIISYQKFIVRPLLTEPRP